MGAINDCAPVVNSDAIFAEPGGYSADNSHHAAFKWTCFSTLATVADMSLFEQLDFIYMPSRDVAGDVRYFTETLGAQLTFAVEGMGTRVAMVELSEQAPRILLAGHLDGERPVMVYRVADIARAIDQLESRGWQRGHTLEIPHGPVCSFTTPGGHRLAIYQLTRPEAGESFVGRRDF